jgi:hypothetical protein
VKKAEGFRSCMHELLFFVLSVNFCTPGMGMFYLVDCSWKRLDFVFPLLRVRK